MSTSTIETIITTMVADIGTVLSDNLPIILGLVALLIGLFFILRLVRRYFGRSK